MIAGPQGGSKDSGGKIYDRFTNRWMKLFICCRAAPAPNSRLFPAGGWGQRFAAPSRLRLKVRKNSGGGEAPTPATPTTTSGLPALLLSKIKQDVEVVGRIAAQAQQER